MFSIIEFSDENCVEFVPSKWIVNGSECLWPNSSHLARKLILDMASPCDSWSVVKCRVLGVASKYIFFCFPISSPKFDSNLKFALFLSSINLVIT
jgi:hypothetical protein